MKTFTILFILFLLFAGSPGWGMDMSMNMNMKTEKTTAGKEVPKAKVLPKISISKKSEEGKDMLVASVTLNGKPLANAKVEFFAQRTFGRISLGTDETLDDGTAAVAFPDTLPGDASGQLKILAKIKEPEQYAQALGEAGMAAAEQKPSGENPSKLLWPASGHAYLPVEEPRPGEPFPRALWSPRPPLALVLTIVVLLCGVWSTYTYVIVQLIKIKKGGSA